MTTTKVALTIQADVLAGAKRQVKAGRARSLSAFVSEAVGEKLRRADLAAVLDAMDAEHGRPSEEDRAWARRVLSRSS
jgi:hypothetical protein